MTNNAKRGGSRRGAVRKDDWFTRCVIMAVQVQYCCSESTARRRLDAFGWRYEKLLTENDAAIMDEWDSLSLWQQGYEVGCRDAELMAMKRSRGLK